MTCHECSSDGRRSEDSAIQHTRDRPDYFVSPWRGFAIAAAYAAVALVAGVIVTNRRDV